MTEETTPHPAIRPYIPVVLLVLSMFVMVAFQTTQMIRERDNLAALRSGQEASVQESLKLRQQLDSIAASTAALAVEGDEAARAIIEDLRRQGITVTPPAKP